MRDKKNVEKTKHLIFIIICDRGKSQARRIELTRSFFRDEVIKGDGTIGITNLVDVSVTRTKR